MDNHEDRRVRRLRGVMLDEYERMAVD